MKGNFFMLMILKAYVGVSIAGLSGRSITFPLKLLEPDLRAFSQYYEAFDKVYFAFLQWPDSIIFRINSLKNDTTNEKWLRIHGLFEKTTMLHSVKQYSAVYYKQETGQFLVPKKGSIKEISPNTLVRYVQNDRTTIKHESTHLLIRYYGLDELEEAIKPFYFKHMNYVKKVLTQQPASFLATPRNTRELFIEYTFSSSSTPQADERLQVLLGTVRKEQLHVKSNIEACKLIFDQDGQYCTVPKSCDKTSEPLQNVFGVRMADKGFMAEIRPLEGRAITLGSNDLTRNPDPKSKLPTFVHDLLQKVKSVDPRYRYWTEDAPKRVKFQMHGKVFIKSVNLKNGRIDKNCPFTIEYAKAGHEFQYGHRSVEKLYTDDSKIWVECEEHVPVTGQTLFLSSEV